jgi:predicted amidophosphoribosyltransferase
MERGYKMYNKLHWQIWDCKTTEKRTFMNFKKTPKGINYLYDYYPKRYEEHGEISRAILRFKDGNEAEIERFANEIKEALILKAGNDISVYEGAKVLTVPSHLHGEWSDSLRMVARTICKELHMINYSRALVRTTNHEKLSLGGDRSIESHVRTIELKKSFDIKGQRILLLDDITTTGNSILACARILNMAGAAGVEAVVIGQTVQGTPKSLEMD